MRATKIDIFRGIMVASGSLPLDVSKRTIEKYCILLALACIPAIGVGAVGMNENATCWLLGDYVWFFWSFWYAFVGFALVSVIAFTLKLKKQSGNIDTVIVFWALLFLITLSGLYGIRESDQAIHAYNFHFLFGLDLEYYS